MFFDEIYWSSTLKNLTWFWSNKLAPYLLYNKDDKNDTIFFQKNSDLILNEKEQSISPNVARTTIEVGFRQHGRTGRGGGSPPDCWANMASRAIFV